MMKLVFRDIEIQADNKEEFDYILSNLNKVADLAPQKVHTVAAAGVKSDEEIQLENKYLEKVGKRFTYRPDGKDEGMSRLEALRLALEESIESPATKSEDDGGEVF